MFFFLLLSLYMFLYVFSFELESETIGSEWFDALDVGTLCIGDAFGYGEDN